MHYKGEKHWKKLSLTAGLREIVNRELCICIVFRDKKAAKPGEKKWKSVVPEGSRGRGPRVQSSHCLVQASERLSVATSIASYGRVPWEQQELHCRDGSLATGCLVQLCDAPQPHLTPALSPTANFIEKMSTANKTFEGKPQIMRRAVSSHQTCVLVYKYKCKVKREVIWQWCEEAVPLKLQLFSRVSAHAMPPILLSNS